MSDPRQWQGKACEHSLEGIPIQAFGFLTSTSKSAIPDAPDLLMECAQRRVVVRHTVIAVMATQHTGKPAMLLGQRRVHVSPRVLAQRLQLTRQAFALRVLART